MRTVIVASLASALALSLPAARALQAQTLAVETGVVDGIGEGAVLDGGNGGGNGGGGTPVSTVPEPATIALLGGGLFVLGVVRRRRVAA